MGNTCKSQTKIKPPLILNLLPEPSFPKIVDDYKSKSLAISKEETGTEIAEENFIHFKIYQFFQNQHERHSLNVPPQIVINRSQNLNDVFREEKNSFTDEGLQSIQEFHKSMQLNRSLAHVTQGQNHSLHKSTKSQRNPKSPVSVSVFKKKSPQLNTEALQNSIMMMKNSTNGVKKESQLKIIKQLQEIKLKYVKLNYDDIDLLENIGEISNGLLFKAYNKKENEIIAIKFLTFEKSQNKEWEDNQDLSDLIQEKLILDRISFLEEKNAFLQLKALYENNDQKSQLEKTMILITEYGRVSLCQLLQQRESYSEKEITYVLFQIICGLYKAQEQLGISHRNISTDNIILMEGVQSHIYKLGRFDYAIQLNPDQKCLTFSEGIPGLIEFYAAPEILMLLENEGMYNPFKADVFSMGLVILEMMGFQRDKIEQMRSENFLLITPEIDLKYPLLFSIVKEMLKINPEKRLSWYSLMMKFANIEKKCPNEEETLKKIKDKMAGIIEEKTLKNYEDFCKLYFELGRWKLTTNYIDLALDLIDKKLGEIAMNPVDLKLLRGHQWKFLGFKAIVCRESGEINEAFSLYHDALEIQEGLLGDGETAELATTYEGIGMVCKLKNNYKEAMQYFEKALSIKKGIFGENDMIIAQLITEIGLLHKLQGDFGKAIEFLTKAVIIAKDLLGEYNIVIATYYTNIGGCQQGQGLYDLALKNYEKALEIRFMSLNENDENIANSYLSIADLYEDSGNISKAIEFHQKVLNIRLLVMKNHQKTAHSYITLGNLYQEEGDLEKSLEHHEKALEISITVYGENDEKTCICYNNIGRICQNMGKTRDALNHHQKALTIRMSLFGLNNLDTSFSLLNVGIVYQDMGNYPKAQEHIEAALGVRLKLFGEFNAHVALGLASLGNLSQDKGDYKAALEFHEKAWRIRMKVLGENHPFTAISYTYLAQSLIELGVYQKALSYNELSYKILKDTLGEKNVLTCVSRSSFAFNLEKMGDLDKALEIQKMVMEWRVQLLGEKSRYVSISLNNIGVILKEMKRTDEALDYSLRALKIRLKVLGENHPETAQSYENLAHIYQDMKKNKERKENKTKADLIKKNIGISKLPIKY